MGNSIRKLLTGSMIVLAMLAVILALPGRSTAQTFYGSVVGTVTDNTGAVVPGATVTISNLGTNEVRTAKTNTAGEFRFVNLIPANYKVTIEAANFKRFVRPSAEVTVDTTLRVDAALQVGAASETVEVTTAAPLLQTESGSLGDAVQTIQMKEIPLNGRNSFNLMALVPGIVPQGNTSGSAAMNNGGSTSSAAWGNYQIGGGLPLQGSIYVDAAPTSIMNKSFAVLVPTPETIQEFNVETSAVSAEFGRFGGGVVNMITKSGANQFHGAAYEYVRNNIVNANFFFTKRNGGARPQWNQNQYGGAVGGPIWKDKAFFFFSWEQISIRTGNPTYTNVPTAAMQAGVFNSLAKLPGTDPGPDGCTFAAYTGQSVNGTTYPSGGYYITNLSTCGDPTAKILATFYPSNYTGTTSNPADNYYKTVSQSDDGHQVSFRADWNITSKNRFFARATLWPLVDGAPNVLGNPNGWNSAGSQTHNHTNQIVAGDTHTFNATTILDVRADYIRQYGDAIPPAFGSVDVTKFGSAYATLAPYMTYHYYPAWNISGNHNLFNFSYNNLTRTYYNNYHLSASVTKILGKHSLKVGVEERMIQRDDIGSDQNSSGNYTIKADLTGDEWANFLQGYFDSGALTTVKAVTSFSFYNGYYLQDTWQTTPKLTLNLGLRYELPGAIGENGNNLVVLLPTATDAVTGITGTEALVNSNQYVSRTTIMPVHSAIGPRVGFAYRLANDTVIRGGYGMSYLPNDQQTGAYANAATINSQTTTNSNTVTGTLKVNYTMSNPFPVTTNLPNGVAPAQGRAYTNFMYANIGGSVTGPYPYEPYPMSQGMNLSIGHQFKGDLLIDIGGAHTIGTHLNSLANIGFDQLPDQYDVCGGDSTQPQCSGNLLSKALTTKLVADGVTLPNSLQNYGQTLRPFPYYKNFSNSTDFHSTTSYNALEAKIQKRFKSTGQIGLAYTWSKLIGDTDTILTSQETKASGSAGEGVYQDYTNRRGDRSIYSYNVPNRLVINYVLNLPFGKGQMLGSGVNGVADRIISGWSVDGITTFQSGFPLFFNVNGTTGGVSDTTLSGTYGAGTMRPNYTAGCTKTVSGTRYARTLSGSTWFNTSCFTVPGVGTPQQGYTFGNEPRVDRSLQMDGIDNWDFSVVKNTPIHDQIGVQIRVEFYNIFNRTQFAAPVTQADNTTFGQVSAQVNKPRLIQGALRINF